MGVQARNSFPSALGVQPDDKGIEEEVGRLEEEQVSYIQPHTVFATSGHLSEDSNLHQSLPGSTGLSPSNTENLPEAEANSQKLLPEQQAGLMGHMKHPNPDYLMP